MSNSKKPQQPLYQCVHIKFSDGKTAVFVGKPAAFPGDTRNITDISFTEPKPLPPDHFFEPLGEPEVKP